MTAFSTSRLVRTLAAVTLTVVALAGVGAPAGAGGWAIASLDATPDAEAGTTEDVSFTILQHGVRPADLDGDVGISLVDGTGDPTFFPAIGTGETGHYVATVTWPETAGRYDWRIRMGWFGDHELGSVEVQAPDAGSFLAWSDLRWVALGGALLLAGVAVADLALARRRRLAPA
ncbi:hypothetical protein BDK89_4152 [Ilumatobacter fluminis]|uniref:YtkA-like protein n=1 Tax=Ilumatobacter fluminis TaxID=467091 RepID=A0A4R7I4J5_9ACTN|nr:hypothetical protein [Ilumatobacter fluminis]TDT18531.1 hypothetical protein BDK89_4152 [Ilumatobacter fluminis]